MEVLLSLVAPSLSKALEVCFLTGFATAYKLQISKGLLGGVGRLPKQKRRRQRPALATLGSLSWGSGGSGDARTLPNDPERQGNIWSRYEQLENSSKSLAVVNQQLIDERGHHKMEKKRLEDTITELRQQLQGVAASTPDPRRVGAETMLHSTPPPLSEASKEVMREMDSPPEVREMRSELNEARSELQRLTEELSDAHNQLDYLRIENQDLQADNQRLQIRSSDQGGRRRSKRSLDNVESPFAASGPGVGTFADEVAAKAAALKGVSPRTAQAQAASLTSFGSDIEMNPNILWTTQSSEGLERAAAGGGENPQVAALKRENRALQERLETVKEGGVVAGLAGAAGMQEKMKKLQEENQRLQNKVLRLDEGPHTRAQEMEEKYNKLLEENTRLQSKIVRLNLGAPGQDGHEAQLEELKEENAELREDNDKLVNYLEALEGQKKKLEESLAGTATPGTDVAAVAAIDQLTLENRRLAEEVEKLKKDSKAAALNSQGSFTTVHVPVSEATGEEIDTDLWMLVEELRDQNRGLIEELREAKGGQSAVLQEQGAAPAGGEGQRILELEKQLAALTEMKSMEMNDGNTKLVKILADENATVQQENMRLVKVLAVGGGTGEGEILREMIASNERLLSEKQKIVAECRRLTEKNARLSTTRTSADGSDSVKLRGPADPPLAKSDSLNNAPGSPKQKRGLLSRFSKSLKNRSSRDGGEDLTVAVSEEGSMTSSVGAPRREPSQTRGASSPGSSQLVQELIEENTKLFEENKKLGQSITNIRELTEANQKLQEENSKLQSGMALVRELSEESSKLVKENKQLSDSLAASLAENQELSSRLINLALHDEDDVFDAAFGDSRDPQPQGGTRTPNPPIDTSAVKQRQEALAEQMRLTKEQNQRDAARRDELSARTNTQLEAYERSKAGGSDTYRKSAASAMARLSSLSRKASISRDSANLARDGSLASQAQEGAAQEIVPEEALEGGEERRRQEAHQAKIDLNKKIQASRKRQSEGSNSGVGAASPQSPSIAEEDSAFPNLEADAEAKACRAYIKHCGNDDLGGFMKAMGYASFESLPSMDDEGALIDLFQRAVNMTAEIQISPVTTPEEKAVAVATHRHLQDWYLQYTSG